MTFFVETCACNPVALGLNLKHSIYAVLNLYSRHLHSACYWIVKRTKMNKKEAAIGPF